MASLPISSIAFHPSFPLDGQASKLIRQTVSPQKEDARIEKSAKDFESLLLGGWLAQAEQSFAKLPGGEDEENADAGSGELQSIAMQSLGTALTGAGGIGLAKVISQQLHRAQAPTQPVDSPNGGPSPSSP